jgi:hypothetical protein
MVVNQECVIPFYMKQQLVVVDMEGILILPFVLVALVYTILVLVKFATNR